MTGRYALLILRVDRGPTDVPPDEGEGEDVAEKLRKSLTMQDVTSRLCNETQAGRLEWEPGGSEDQWLVDLPSGKRFVLTRSDTGIVLSIHDVSLRGTTKMAGVKIPTGGIVSGPLAVADQRHDAAGLDYLWGLATGPWTELRLALDALESDLEDPQ